MIEAEKAHDLYTAAAKRKRLSLGWKSDMKAEEREWQRTGQSGTRRLV